MKKFGLLMIVAMISPAVSHASDTLNEGQCVLVKIALENAKYSGMQVAFPRNSASIISKDKDETDAEFQERVFKMKEQDAIADKKADEAEKLANKKLAARQKQRSNELQKLYDDGQCGNYNLDEIQNKIDEVNSKHSNKTANPGW